MYGYFQPHDYFSNDYRNQNTESLDFGGRPFVVDIKKATRNNENFRTALWSGNHIQLTVMNIPVGEDIGLEMHPDVDQFLCVEDGTALVKMGNRQDQLGFQQLAFQDDAILIPSGTWHNVTNIGNKDLKIFSIYGPPNHPKGTVHQTKQIAESMENR